MGKPVGARVRRWHHEAVRGARISWPQSEETEDTNIEATMEATPEVESFMDSSKPAQQESDGVQGDPETEVRYKKRYDDLKKYYDQKLSEWKQEKETLKAQKSTIEQAPKQKHGRERIMCEGEYTTAKVFIRVHPRKRSQI